MIVVLILFCMSARYCAGAGEEVKLSLYGDSGAESRKNCSNEIRTGSESGRKTHLLYELLARIRIKFSAAVRDPFSHNANKI